MSDDWEKEFMHLTFQAPYCGEYVQHSLNKKRLKQVNLKFDLFYNKFDKKRSTVIVRFSDNVKEYYPT